MDDWTSRQGRHGWLPGGVSVPVCVRCAQDAAPKEEVPSAPAMALVDLASVAPLTICPRCGCRLLESGATFRCSSTSCAFLQEAFPLVEQWPVLVDFERSILRPDDLGSAGQPRRRRWSIERLPARLRNWWKPVNRVAVRNVELLLALLPGPSPLVLVIGGGTVGNGVDAIYVDRRTRVVGFDIYGSPLTQFIADAHDIPLADGSVDAVLIQAVLEHVLDPGRVVREIRRVLRPGGLVYAETPFLQQVHAGAYDFVRFTASGHRYLFRAFEEISAGPVAGPGTQLLWSLDHTVRALSRSELAGKVARGLLFWLRHLDRLVSPAFAMDAAAAYYFLGRRADRELTQREIVDYYRGAQR
jgi:ubiquinone/menaquinone biosynthesis C-methylase UbiE